MQVVEQYMAKVGTLVKALTKVVPELQQVKSRSEAMLTIYPATGARYRRHVDNPDGTKSSRKLTVICYLNPEWQPGHGGELQVTGIDWQDSRRGV